MSFSWKRAGVHVGLFTVLLIGGGAALVALTNPADPEALGEGMGKLLFFLLLGALGVSWLWQTGHKKAVAIIVGSVAALAGVGVVVGLAGRGHEFPPLSAAEKAPLETRGPRLVHPTLAFSVAAPGPAYEIVPGNLVDSSFDPKLDIHGYAYVDADSGPRVLMILVSSHVPGSRGELEELLHGVKAALLPNMKALTGADAASMHLDGEELTWRDGRAEGHTHFTNGSAHFRVDVHTVGAPEARRMVVLIGLTRSDDVLAPLLASFQG